MLEGLGLYASQIQGDGNCLFRALSDQLYGNQNEAKAIRADVVQHMRDNSYHYKSFIHVGGERRAPKRKTAGALPTVDSTLPTDEDIDRAFNNRLATMAKGGVWGGDVEIAAFCAAYNVDVKVYKHEIAYQLQPFNQPSNEDRPMVHIAHHAWEHYSSIRNLKGPHTGMPNIAIQPLSPEEEQRRREKLARTSCVQQWMVDSVTTSLPHLADTQAIMKAIQDARGDVNTAVSKLLDAERSSPSTQGSSSIEREPDSDDEELGGPKKRQDRRLSKASKAVIRMNMHRRREMLLKATAQNGSQESLTSIGTHSVVPRGTTVIEIPNSDDEWHYESSYKGEYNLSSSASSSGNESPQQKIPTRVKINFNPSKSESRSFGKTKQNQTGPQQRRGPSAREKKDIKKKAQKTARKERAIAEAKSTASDKQELPAITNSKKPASGLDSGFRVLCI